MTGRKDLKEGRRATDRRMLQCELGKSLRATQQIYNVHPPLPPSPHPLLTHSPTPYHQHPLKKKKKKKNGEREGNRQT